MEPWDDQSEEIPMGKRASHRVLTPSKTEFCSFPILWAESEVTWALASQEMYLLPCSLFLSHFSGPQHWLNFPAIPEAPRDQAAASRLVSLYTRGVKLNIFLHL